MIPSDLLEYDGDEERRGFPAPSQQGAAPGISPQGRLGGVAMLAGLLSLILQCAGWFNPGGWAGLATSYGLLVPGAVLSILERYRGTAPGIKHDGTMFRSMQNRGIMAWPLALAITGFYVVLYFYDDLQRDYGLPALLDRPAAMLNPLSRLLSNGDASRWFL